MKIIHEFTINKVKDVEQSETQKDEKGVEIKIIKMIPTDFPVKLSIKKPSRSMLDQGELYYSASLSEGIRSGLLTRAMLTKRIINEGGLLSDEDLNNYKKLYSDFLDKQTEFLRLRMKNDPDKSDEDKLRIQALQKELEKIRDEIQQFEMIQDALFQHTAENRARNRTIVWWVMQLAHIQEDSAKAAEPLFGTGDDKAKGDKYTEIIDSEDPFYTSVIDKLVLYVTMWYSGYASKTEEFIQLEAALEQKA